MICHCYRIHSSLTAVHCFDDGYVRRQPMAWKEYCAGVPVKESSKAWIGVLATEIMLKMALCTI